MIGPELTQSESRGAASYQVNVASSNPAFTIKTGDTFIDLFEKQVSRTPDHPALIFKNDFLSYHQLNKCANRVAHFLIGKDLDPNSILPVSIERSLEMFIAILGILKAGHAYVPLEPDAPKERTKHILQELKARSVICSANSFEKFSEQYGIDCVNVNEIMTNDGLSVENTGITVSCQQLAYVLYTSGSAGKPKGVMIEHGSLINYLVNSKTNYIGGTNISATFLHLPYTFDASVTSMLLPLLRGKQIVLSSKQSFEVFDDENFYKYAPYDFLKITPTHLEFLKDKIQYQRHQMLTRKLVIGGEALALKQLNYFIEKGYEIEIINEYGPTEATVGCTVFNFSTHQYGEVKDNVPIGKCIDNVQIYLVDEKGKQVPNGKTGEIWISGACLAREYISQSASGEKKFIPNPFGEGRIYKSGDLARMNETGNLEYIGRKDDQVKIRGYRIEPAEVEEALQKFDGIRQAIVLAKEKGDQHRQMVAFILTENKIDRIALEIFLKERLPQYMIPDLIFERRNFPVTYNGKIDKQELLKSAEIELPDYERPRSEVEIKLLKIWKTVLGIKRVGLAKNFFEVGGNSILAVQAVSRAQKAGILLQPIDMYLYPTIAELAKEIEKRKAVKEELSSIAPIQTKGNKIPFFTVPGFWFYTKLSHYLGNDQPFYGFEPVPNLNADETADKFIRELKKIRSHGPYFLGAYCDHYPIIFLMAHKLRSSGDKVPVLILFEAHSPDVTLSKSSTKYIFRKFSFYNRHLRTLTLKNKIHFLVTEMKKAGKAIAYRLKRHEKKVHLNSFNGNLVLFRASDTSPVFVEDPHMGWRKYVDGTIETITIEGDHFGIMTEENYVKGLAVELKKILQKYTQAMCLLAPIFLS